MSCTLTRRKEARKAKLKAAAGTMKSTGNDQQVGTGSAHGVGARLPALDEPHCTGLRVLLRVMQVFNKSDYSLPEEARTPNMHSRQVRPHPRAGPGQRGRAV
jgi:hypothetical protein